MRAVDGLDLDVERGEVFGYLGPNGAGKTTTIRLLLDFVRPTMGTARVLDSVPAEIVARGALTVVCVSQAEDGAMKATDLPPEIAAKIEVAPKELLTGR